MKRSEMKKILMQPIYVDDGVCFGLFEPEVEAILKRIEDAGILPPSIPDPTGYEFVNEWEPEETR